MSPLDPDQIIMFTEIAVGASALAAHPRRPLLAVTRGNDVLVYRTPSLEPVVRFDEHKSTVWLLIFSPDGRWLASGDGEGQIGLVCIDQPESSRLLATLTSETRAMAFAPSGNQLATIDGTGQLTTWEVETGERRSGFHLDGVTAHSLAYVAKDEIIVGDSVGRIRLINLSAEAQLRTWKAHEGPVWSMLMIRSRIVSSGQEGSICISDSFGNVYHRLPKQSAAVWSLAYDSMSGYLWASTVSGRALRWQTRANLPAERL